jgi:hypothetical protein
MKKLFLMIATIFMTTFCWSFAAHSFSSGFKAEMTDFQKKVMLDGKKMTPKEAISCWGKFDDEILGILSHGKPTEAALNRETARIELSYIEHYKKEIDEIELGNIETKFYRLETPEGVAWLAILSNRMGNLSSSTFHIYREENGKYRRVAALEETRGPWSSEKNLWGVLQIQTIRNGSGSRDAEFASYHLPFSKSGKNRSEIVWKFDGSRLKGILWFPEVDWHKEKGKMVQGRGEAVRP